jgi:hypothetical protein
MLLKSNQYLWRIGTTRRWLLGAPPRRMIAAWAYAARREEKVFTRKASAKV